MSVVSAVFYDVENLGCCDRWYEHGAWNIKALLAEVERAAPLGQVRIQKAYLDLARPGLEKVKTDLARSGCENVDILSKGIGPLKNAADIQLCIDAVEVLLSKDFVTQFVIVSGDGDFFPLARKLRGYGKSVVGVAMEGGVNRAFEDLCDTFVRLRIPVVTRAASVTLKKGQDFHVADQVKDPIVRRMAQVIRRAPSAERKQVFAKAREIVAWLGTDSGCMEAIRAGTLSADVLHEALKYAVVSVPYERGGQDYRDVWDAATSSAAFRIKGSVVALRKPALASSSVPPAAKSKDSPNPPPLAPALGGAQSAHLLRPPSEVLKPEVSGSKPDPLLVILEPMTQRLLELLVSRFPAAPPPFREALLHSLEFLSQCPQGRGMLAGEGVPVRFLVNVLRLFKVEHPLSELGYPTRAELIADVVAELPLRLDRLHSGLKVVRWGDKPGLPSEVPQGASSQAAPLFLEKTIGRDHGADMESNERGTFFSSLRQKFAKEQL